MKKGIIVLLITVLVAGVAFAAGTLKGSAGLSFKVDLDNKTWGFSNDKAWKYTFNFEFDTTKVEVGEHQTDLWAELAISGKATAGLKEATGAEGDFHGAYAVSLDKAEIHVGEDLVFGLLNAGSAVDFAKHYATKGDDDKIADTVKGPSKILPGFTVTYKEWNGGIGARGKWNDDESFYNVFAHIETPSFKFAEDKIAVSAGAYTVLSNEPATGNDWSNTKTFGGAAKLTFTDEKLSADAEADLKFVKPGEADGKFVYEAAANATYKLNDADKVYVNVYATPGQMFPKATVAAMYTGDYAETLKLDAKAGAGYTIVSEDNMKVGISGYAQIEDALLEKRELTVSATETVELLEKKALSLSFTETYKILVAKELELKAVATYTAEKFVATATINPTFKFGDEAKMTHFKVSAEIYSTAVIENAKIGLKYAGADYAEGVEKKGAVTAYVTIEF